jgi:plastocyanin
MNLRRLVVTSTLAAALAVGVAACGGDGGDQGGVASGGGPVVQLKDNKFSPRDLTVRAGQPVTWDWKDRFVQHNVVGADFASKTQRRGIFTHTYAKAGTYPYRCTLHADMKGTITVTASQ